MECIRRHRQDRKLQRVRLHYSTNLETIRAVQCDERGRKQPEDILLLMQHCVRESQSSV